jgi:hypothetical protein
MANYLFKVQEKNRLAQKGLLRRFSINCMGHQETVEEMRAEKAEKFAELKDKKNSPEYDEWFLRYRPTDKLLNDKDETRNKTNKNIKANSKTRVKKDINKKKKKKKTQKRKGLFF